MRLQAQHGVADLQQTRENTREAILGHYYGLYLYRCGDYEQAAKVMELYRGQSAALDLVCVVALAELQPDGHARATKLHEEIAARDLGPWDLFNSQLILRFLGRKDEALEISRKFLTRPGRFPHVRQDSFRCFLEYCAGERSAEELVASVDGSRGELSNAHLCIALTALADGDRAKAKLHLRRCVDTHFYEFLPYDLGKMLLSRMDRDKDHTWPPWIKPLK